MSKKVNTLLFILGATVFNVLVAVVCFILLFVLYTRFFFNWMPENAFSYIILIFFVVAIAVSFVTYRLVLKVIMNKVDMDKYFDPLFIRRNKTP